MRRKGRLSANQSAIVWRIRHLGRTASTVQTCTPRILSRLLCSLKRLKNLCAPRMTSNHASGHVRPCSPPPTAPYRLVAKKDLTMTGRFSSSGSVPTRLTSVRARTSASSPGVVSGPFAHGGEHSGTATDRR